MQVSALTDDELRSLIDIQPDNLDAVREGARRFVEGSSQEAEEIERLREETVVLERDLKAMEEKAAELQEELENA